MEKVTVALGKRLRELRRSLGWSLDHAAAQTGVSKAMLGQIERGESSPTIATLWKVATGFQVSFTRLVAGLSLNSLALADGEHLHALESDPGIEVTVRFAFDPSVNFEWVELRLAPGSESHSDAHQAGVTERILVLEGELELWLAGEWQRYQAGATVCFDADQPHGYRNSGMDVLVFQDVIHYA
ncbi:helix-turn-helix domain-containing protein [Nitrincola sp.]|uniref:helix-turn-helix domain-containing protein n=1 Tax=Nitrincola sp. TaxID=1926584 RepID=UPI003A9489EF